MNTFTLHIPDMSCGHCVSTLTDALRKADPQATLQADLATHEVVIHGTDRQAAVLAAFQEAGYTPQPR